MTAGLQLRTSPWGMLKMVKCSSGQQRSVFDDRKSNVTLKSLGMADEEGIDLDDDEHSSQARISAGGRGNNPTANGGNSMDFHLNSNSDHEVVLKQYEEDMSALKVRVMQLESMISHRDSTIQQLHSRLEHHGIAAKSMGEAEFSAAMRHNPIAISGPLSDDSCWEDSTRCDSSDSKDRVAAQNQIESLQSQVALLQANLAQAQAALSSTTTSPLDAASSMTRQQQSRHEAISRQSSRRRSSDACSASECSHKAQLDALQAALAMRDSRLASMMQEVNEIRAAGTKDLPERTNDKVKQLEAAVEAVTAERDAALATVNNLQGLLNSSNDKPAARTEQQAPVQAVAVQEQLRKEKEQHAQQVAELEAELKLRDSQLAQLKAEVQRQAELLGKDVETAKAQAEASVKATFVPKLQAMQSALDMLHQFREGILEDLISMQNELFSDKVQTQMTRLVRDKELAVMKKAKAEASAEIEKAKKEADVAIAQAENQQAALQQQLKILQLESTGQLQYYKQKWVDEFEKRKRLHNQVLDLKGNIRVFCRVRPFVERELSNKDEAPAAKALSEDVLKIFTDKGDRSYEFDRVFAPVDGQDKVFQEVEPLVTTVLDGFNVCIMAYGQTGSGKTYTMEGPVEEPGVNTRALKELFKLAGERSGSWTYSFSASVLEIYNEQIYDLLSGGREQDGDKLDIKQGPEGMHVPGLRIEEVQNDDQVAAIVARGKANRSTFSTNMNEHSSRSHLVLTVYVTATPHFANAAPLRGKLHLIDLAGSERLARTGAQGDRLKEAQNINKSLSALGDVIQALQQRAVHIPFRNSKLTRLLEDSLGSNCKCVMVVNVSPAQESVAETKCSLDFASRARKVELGRVRANTLSTSYEGALSDFSNSNASTPKGAGNISFSSSSSRPTSSSSQQSPVNLPKTVSRSSLRGSNRSLFV